MRAPLVAALLACGGLVACKGGGGTFVIVEIQAGSSTPSGIHSIDLDLTLGGRSTTATFTAPGGGDISLPTDGTLEIGSGAGSLTIVAHARGAGGQTLDTGTGQGVVATGDTTRITVQLGTAPGDGGAGGTGGADGGGGDAPPGGDGGPDPALVRADKDRFDFGTVITGTPSSATVITVQNAGGQRTGALIVGVVDAVSFPTGADTCNGIELDPGATCTVSVQFQPASAGSKTTILRIGGTPGGTASVSLSGTGVDPGALVVSPGQRDFGPISQGQTSPETTFRISNTGGAATTALTVSLTGSNASEFHVANDTCSNMVLEPATTCTVGVSFTPTATGTPGAKTASLTVSAATGGTTVAALSGAALGPASLMVVPTDQDFGMVVQGLPSGEKLFTVANGGGQASGALTASIAPAGEFAISSNTCDGVTLAAGATCKVGVKMTPAGLGARAATLTVAGNPGGSAAATLRGTGLAPGMVVLSPSPKDFGTVDVGSSSSASFTVTNSGQAPTTALSVTLSGAADFSLSSNTCSGNVLAAGASCTFAVSFAPGGFGPRSGSVTAGATTGGSSTAALSGTGRDYVTLTVTKAGTGAGTVAATGLTCTNNTCVGSYARTSSATFQSVAISAAPDALSTFGGWSGGGCSGTGGCMVTMDAAKTVTATFTIKTVNITVNNVALAGHTGAVTSDDSTINCTAGTCGPQTHPAVASLTLTAKASGTSTFVGWGGGPCQGTKPTCTLAPLTSDVTVTATFGPQAYMFVTSSLVTPGRLGGVSGADAECVSRASAAGLPGTYRAWISTTGTDAIARVGNGGWVRTDGRPFAPSATALKTTVNQIVYYPPRVDELGHDLGPNRIVVGTGGNSDGTAFSGTTGTQCANYTTTSGGMYMGMATSGTQYWAYDFLDSSGCNTPVHLYCFRTDLTTTITPPPVAGRRMFVSNAPFVPAGGLAMADLQCQNDAKAAAFPNFANYVALLSTGAASAASRVSLSGAPWKRPDEVQLVLKAADLTSGLFAPVDVSASGVYASRAVWTGSSDVSLPSDGNSCNDWSIASASGSSYFGYPGFAQVPDWFNSGRITCDYVNIYLICAER